LHPALLTTAAMEADPAFPTHLCDQLMKIREAITSELQFVNDLLASERESDPSNLAN
jgi:hypothetical protein